MLRRKQQSVGAKACKMFPNEDTQGLKLCVSGRWGVRCGTLGVGIELLLATLISEATPTNTNDINTITNDNNIHSPHNDGDHHNTNQTENN